MTTETAAGQILIGGIYGTNLSAADRRRIEAGHLGGVILMGRNIESPDQVRALLDGAASATPAGLPPPLLGVDQEGGRVARLKAPVLEIPSARRLGGLGDEALTRGVMATLGRQLRLLGFTVDFAPVLDIDGGGPRQVIGDRSYGGEAEAVRRQGVAALLGLLDGGICPCGKHFPGHGATTTDSHQSLPIVERSAEELTARELLPFVGAIEAGLPLLMPAHVIFRAFDEARPATFSPAILQGLLRAQLGYEGVVITDDLVMGAVAQAGGAVEVAVDVLVAGADLLLVCHDLELQEKIREAIAAAARRSATVSRRLEEAAARALALRERFSPAKAPTEPLSVLLERDRLPEAAAALVKCFDE